MFNSCPELSCKYWSNVIFIKGKNHGPLHNPVAGAGRPPSMQMAAVLGAESCLRTVPPMLRLHRLSSLHVKQCQRPSFQFSNCHLVEAWSRIPGASLKVVQQPQPLALAKSDP
jgi:hypothetical protein